MIMNCDYKLFLSLRVIKLRLPEIIKYISILLMKIIMRTVRLKSQYFKHDGLQILLYKIIIIIETIQIYIFLKIKRIYLEHISYRFVTDGLS